jgi:hypothetical protein
MQPVADYLQHSWKVTTGQEYPYWVKTERQKEFYEDAAMALGLTSPFRGGGVNVLKEVEAMSPVSKGVEKLEPVGEKALGAVSKERGHEGGIHEGEIHEEPPKLGQNLQPGIWGDFDAATSLRPQPQDKFGAMLRGP